MQAKASHVGTSGKRECGLRVLAVTDPTPGRIAPTAAGARSGWTRSAIRVQFCLFRRLRFVVRPALYCRAFPSPNGEGITACLAERNLREREGVAGDVTRSCRAGKACCTSGSTLQFAAAALRSIATRGPGVMRAEAFQGKDIVTQTDRFEALGHVYAAIQRTSTRVRF
ncbi:hypothetical protein PYCCODRAFT_1302692 [Trametes coccinea BRFM310]|uniref:Uncharacterized protein n=1 Tax=Trametes coccinea (strain BRFM310) TaxID=1353009 RepID=A0A1Y2I7Y0_TRAC3|nr:hypothetical protein PYCCODRAFT_1302692 [Trametes coccinea BRFM310]